jgi:predicted RNase H-like nuclease (RuvC/YqgF family)
MLVDDKTIYEQEVYDHYKKIETENFHLKYQLSHKNKEIKRLKRIISKFNEKLKESHKTKQHYKNGQKRGSHGRNG